MKFLPCLLAVICPLTCCAVETHFWQQGERADFEKGSLNHLSLRSDGRIFLAPEFSEIFDSSTPYLWAVAADSKGNLYTAGGGSGSGLTKLFQIDRSGKSRTFSELDGLEIHAVAVDAKDQVYAATDPDGKVYRISSDGKARTFYDPHQKYIWAMVFNSKGDLFVATGDQGEIHRVTSNGSGSVFFKTEETHARSLAIDGQDNLIVGTEPNGLILRVSPSGQGFVLYQAPKREITAVAVAKNGSIYAAGVGSKTPAPAPAVTPAVVVPQGSNPAAAQNPALGNLTNRNFLPPVTLTGGSEVYRINADGSPKKIWSNTQDVVYTVAFDQSGHTLLGTGNRGKIYRLDTDAISTVLVDATPTQVTGFGTNARGDLYAVTGNIGKVFRIGPGIEKSGFFESEVLDAGSFSYWGRISYRGSGNISISTRSGNLNHPESNWSLWAPVQPDARSTLCDSCGGGRTSSPSARFFQYKLELTSSAAAPSPEVLFVESAYLPKNVAPSLEAVEVTSPNYRFPRPSAPATSGNTTTLTLPPLGQQKRNTFIPESEGNQTLTYAKGYIGTRWLARDEDGDSLVYKVEIRGVKESTWQLLKDGVKEKYLSWDSTAFPDGEYVIRVTASDSPSNPRDQALEDSLTSDPLVIDNTPPQIANLAGTVAGNNIDVRWTARDSRSNLNKAEYSVNGGDWMAVDPLTKLSDSPEQQYHLVIERTSPGEQVVAVRVTDDFDNQAVEKVVVK